MCAIIMLLYSFPFPSLDPTQHGGRHFSRSESFCSGRSCKHLNVHTYIVIQIGVPVTIQPSAVWMSV